MVKLGDEEPSDHIFTVLSRHEDAKVFGSLGFTAMFMI